MRVLGSCSFLYMRHSDVYILAVTRNNANAMLTFQFLSNVSRAPMELQLADVCADTLTATHADRHGV